jgi:hypothetical protein
MSRRIFSLYRIHRDGLGRWWICAPTDSGRGQQVSELELEHAVNGEIASLRYRIAELERQALSYMEE